MRGARACVCVRVCERECEIQHLRDACVCVVTPTVEFV